MTTKTHPVDAAVSNLEALTQEQIQARLGELEAAAEPIREAREEVNKKILKLQDEVAKLSVQLREVEAPMRAMRKMVTFGIRAGTVKGKSASVGPARAGTSA